MKKKGRCSSRGMEVKSGCHAKREIETVQQFPTHGRLAENLGLPLPILKSQIGRTSARSYSYIVRTVKFDHETSTFEQHGSAPNFQGDVLTLCTCKHHMRASQDTQEWEGVWIAGFTSRTIYDRRHWLFYLAHIESAYESHVDLWKALKVRSKNAKAADAHFLGDVFRPKTPFPGGTDRFSPSRYVTPSAHAHRQHRGDKGWHNDIHYYLAVKYGYPPLLAANPQKTFLWDEPLIYFADKHCRNFHKWSSLSELISQLREAR